MSSNDLLDRQLEREAAAPPAADPCGSIRYPGDDASSLAHASYYVAIAACVGAGSRLSTPEIPASVRIAGELAEAREAESRAGLAKSRLWLDGILGALDLGVSVYNSQEDRKSAERISDREISRPGNGGIWLQGGSRYTVNTGSNNPDNRIEDSRHGYGNATTTAEDNDITSGDTVTDSHNDSSDHSRDNDTTDNSVREDSDVTFVNDRASCLAAAKAMPGNSTKQRSMRRRAIAECG